ncbi:two component transcriptional regulator, winged helix family [Denitrovibrio acetiphilus DSM 12809]|uniref:Two component transcriptional regulator, winged helix family n=1 Tax=Denitrovibrio acetiphilus (strain DSM 12809 / NBRC 114555 / N2460) TaxID=522772 RepID=D4H8R3_DENA2|nr:response regulator transcription factor [Denitrovibrio acetiphilus]ADD68412.1 two component transcriptional regulator, winged helix family [Denitrovibrio acetiphilus DSM 12809]
MRILLVEDDFDLSENIIDFLTDCGYDCDFAYNGIVAVDLIKQNPYDLIILDIGLPGINGFEVCRIVRQDLKLNTPVIMLTALISLDDKLSGFQAGTDDYLPKPFDMPELQARIEALAKRTRPVQNHVLTVGSLVYDVEQGILTRNNIELQLPPVCMHILRILMEASPNLVSKSELEYAIWGHTPPETDALKAHLYTLRNIIDKPFSKNMLVTVRGQGYKVVASE